MNMIELCCTTNGLLVSLTFSELEKLLPQADQACHKLFYLVSASAEKIACATHVFETHLEYTNGHPPQISLALALHCRLVEEPSCSLPQGSSMRPDR